MTDRTAMLSEKNNFLRLLGLGQVCRIFLCLLEQKCMWLTSQENCILYFPHQLKLMMNLNFRQTDWVVGWWWSENAQIFFSFNLMRIISLFSTILDSGLGEIINVGHF